MTTVLESLNQGLLEALEEDMFVILLGEDILDPYGGAFKVTRGLSTKFPDRVLTTPISEAGITGLATGMALRGYRPVVEIMFGDFLTLAADQLINHAAKFRWMYNEKVRVPLVVRTPMGGRRGYGPTHSQTLEKLFLGIPGLRVVAPSTVGSPGDLLKKTITQTEDPVLFVENKLQYLLDVNQGFGEFKINDVSVCDKNSIYHALIIGSPPPQVTLVTYGYMVELSRQAMIRLAYEEEIFVEMFVYEDLTPFAPIPLKASLDETKNLLIVEEGTYSLGWGAEVIAKTMESLNTGITSVSRLAARETPVPASTPLENTSLPGVDSICKHICNLVSAGYNRTI